MDSRNLEAVHRAVPRLVRQLEERRIDRRSFLRTTTLLGLSATTAYALAGEVLGDGIAAPAAAQQEGAVRGGVLRMGMAVMDVSDPATVDWSEKGNLLRQVIEPLVQIGTDDVSRPCLAESWEPNDDLTVWTFHLRRNALWNNGDPFTADDVVANFHRWLDPATGSSNLGRFSALTVTENGSTRMADGAVEKVDDHTVRFNLLRPMLALPESMGDYPALIVHRDFDAMGGNFLDNPIGTGPFLLDEFRIRESASFSKRDPAEYWGDEVYLDGVRFIDLGSESAAHLAALASDQVDILYTLDVNLLQTVGAMPNLRVFEKTTAITGIARMRVTEEPFGNKALRQAIQACVDRPRVMELAYAGHGDAGQDHHVSPIHPEFVDIGPPETSIDRARALLAEAGYPDGIELDLIAVNDPRWEGDLAQVIAEQCAEAGIRINVNVMPGATYWDRWDTWPFSVTQWTTRPLAVQALALGYRSGGEWNETGYSNPEFDDLLAEAEATIDLEDRRELVGRLSRIMQEDAITIIPFWLKMFTASTTRVNGFSYHFAREAHLNTVWLG